MKLRTLFLAAIAFVVLAGVGGSCQCLRPIIIVITIIITIAKFL